MTSKRWVAEGDKVSVEGGEVDNFICECLTDWHYDVFRGEEFDEAKEAAHRAAQQIADEHNALVSVIEYCNTLAQNIEESGGRTLSADHVLSVLSQINAIARKKEPQP